MNPVNPTSSRVWALAFIAALLCLAGALAFLLYASFQQFGDGADDDAPPMFPGVTPEPSPTATSESERPRVWIDPAITTSATSEAFALAGSRDGADVIVEPGGNSSGFAWQVLVPVVSFEAGVDALSMAQLRAIFSGEVTDWAEVGGVPGPISPAVVISQEDQLAEMLSVELGSVQGRYNDSLELLAAMAPGAGMIAFVPLERVHAGVMAVAVDGVDPVRGRGAFDNWPFVSRARVQATTDAGEALTAAVVDALAVVPPTATTVVATGDILPVRCSLAQIEATGDFGSPFRGAMADYLSSADLTLGSLDTSIQDVNEPYRCVETTNLTTPPESIEMLTLAGFDIITVATNHVFDCGVDFCGTDAFLQTLDRLRGAGIAPIGGGTTIDEAIAPAITEVNGVTFAVLGFDDVAAMDLEATDTAPGTAPLDDDYSEERAAGEPAFYRPAEELTLTRFTASITAAREQADVVIVLLQSGTEDTHTPSPRSLKAVRAAIAAGADVVVGNQAHVVQALEPGDDHFAAYALGNFLFDQLHTPQHSQGYLLEMTFWGDRLANVRLVPYEIVEQYRPVFAEGALRASILGDVYGASAALRESE